MSSKLLTILKYFNFIVKMKHTNRQKFKKQKRRYSYKIDIVGTKE